MSGFSFQFYGPRIGERSKSEGLVNTPLCTRCCLEADRKGTSGRVRQEGDRAVLGTGCAMCVQAAASPLGSAAIEPLLIQHGPTGWLTALGTPRTILPERFKADEGICLVAASVRQVPSVIWAQLTVEGQPLSPSAG